MPQRNEPIKERPKVEDESTGPEPAERHGKHRQEDEALPGKGSAKGGMNRESGTKGGQPGRGVKQSRD